MTDRDLLRECRLQLEYLNEKFQETGTTNALLVKINLALLDMPIREEWVCNACGTSNFTSSIPEHEIEQELHACIDCGGFEFHLERTE